MAVAVQPLMQPTPQAREEKVAMYVVLSALEDLLFHLVDGVGDGGPLEFVRDVLVHDNKGYDLNPILAYTIGRNFEASTVSLRSELWPEDGTGEDVPYEERPEWRLADARADVLTARLFAALATQETREFSLAQADRSAEASDRVFFASYYRDSELRAGMPCGECGVAGGCEHFPKEGDDA